MSTNIAQQSYIIPIAIEAMRSNSLINSRPYKQHMRFCSILLNEQNMMRQGRNNSKERALHLLQKMTRMISGGQLLPAGRRPADRFLNLHLSLVPSQELILVHHFQENESHPLPEPRSLRHSPVVSHLRHGHESDLRKLREPTLQGLSLQ